MILEVTCSNPGIIQIAKILKTVFQMIQIIGPILAMVSLGILFFRLMVFDYDERTNVNATKKYIGVKKQVRNALLALVITFFLPYIVSLVMNMTFMVDNFTVAECWSEADKIKRKSRLSLLFYCPKSWNFTKAMFSTRNRRIYNLIINY